MTKLRALFARVRKDENGATLIEYSVLIGLLTVATIATILLVGTWVQGQWAALDTALPDPAPAPAPAPAP
jgi:pilus assembly protein Flp/PilA